MDGFVASGICNCGISGVRCAVGQCRAEASAASLGDHSAGSVIRVLQQDLAVRQGNRDEAMVGVIRKGRDAARRVSRLNKVVVRVVLKRNRTAARIGDLSDAVSCIVREVQSAANRIDDPDEIPAAIID